MFLDRFDYIFYLDNENLKPRLQNFFLLEQSIWLDDYELEINKSTKTKTPKKKYINNGFIMKENNILKNLLSSTYINRWSI